MSISREARVGIVVGLGILTLAITVLFFRNVRSSVREYEVTVLLDDAGGILKGADVYFAGVRVGRVKEEPIIDEDRAKLTLSIRRDIDLYSNYDFAVRSGALLGDRYVIITRREGYGFRLADSQQPEVEGRGPSSVEELLPKTKKLMDDFDVLMSDFRGVVKEVHLMAQDLRASATGVKKVMGDPEMQRAVKGTVVNLHQTSEAMQRLAASPQLQGTLANINSATGSLGQMSTNANQLVKRTDELVKNMSELVGFFGDVAKTNRENLDQAIASLPEMMTNLKDMTAELKRILQTTGSQDNLDQINATLKSVNQATENLAHITQDVQQLTGDPQTRSDVKQMLSNLNQTTESAKKVLENLEATTASLRDLSTDSQVQTDLKQTIHETKETVTTAKETLQEGKQAIAEGRQTLSRVNKVLGGGGGGILKTKVQPDIRLWQVPSTNRFVSDFDLWISSSPKRRFVLGLHDVTESDKLTMQFAPAVGSVGYARLGLYRGKLGAGFDWLNGRTWVSLNAYDPNDLTGNLWGGYRLFRNWEVLLGVEGLGRSGAQVGVGVRVTK